MCPSPPRSGRSEEHTSELQSQSNLVCRLLLEKKKTPPYPATSSKTNQCTGFANCEASAITESGAKEHTRLQPVSSTPLGARTLASDSLIRSLLLEIAPGPYARYLHASSAYELITPAFDRLPHSCVGDTIVHVGVHVIDILVRADRVRFFFF